MQRVQATLFHSDGRPLANTTVKVYPTFQPLSVWNGTTWDSWQGGGFPTTDAHGHLDITFPDQTESRPVTLWNIEVRVDNRTINWSGLPPPPGTGTVDLDTLISTYNWGRVDEPGENQVVVVTGPPGMMWARAWVNDRQYVPTEVVTFGNFVWISRTVNLNVEPFDGSPDWDIVLQPGVISAGDAGQPGVVKVDQANTPWPIALTQKSAGQPSPLDGSWVGIATLDTNGFVPEAQLPTDALIGGVTLGGDLIGHLPNPSVVQATASTPGKLLKTNVVLAEYNTFAAAIAGIGSAPTRLRIHRDMQVGTSDGVLTTQNILAVGTVGERSTVTVPGTSIISGSVIINGVVYEPLSVAPVPSTSNQLITLRDYYPAIANMDLGTTKTVTQVVATIPKNVTTEHTMGGKLSAAPGVVLVHNGAITNRAEQIFDLSGGGSIRLSPVGIDDAFPEWWGAKGDSTASIAGTDCYAAFQAAYNASTQGSGIRVCLTGSIYSVSDTVLISSAAGQQYVVTKGYASRKSGTGNYGATIMWNGPNYAGPYIGTTPGFVASGASSTVVSSSTAGNVQKITVADVTGFVVGPDPIKIASGLKAETHTITAIDVPSNTLTFNSILQNQPNVGDAIAHGTTVLGLGIGDGTIAGNNGKLNHRQAWSAFTAAGENSTGAVDATVLPYAVGDTISYQAHHYVNVVAGSLAVPGTNSDWVELKPIIKLFSRNCTFEGVGFSVIGSFQNKKSCWAGVWSDMDPSQGIICTQNRFEQCAFGTNILASHGPLAYMNHGFMKGLRNQVNSDQHVFLDCDFFWLDFAGVYNQNTTSQVKNIDVQRCNFSGRSASDPSQSQYGVYMTSGSAQFWDVYYGNMQCANWFGNSLDPITFVQCTAEICPQFVHGVNENVGGINLIGCRLSPPSIASAPASGSEVCWSSGTLTLIGCNFLGDGSNFLVAANDAVEAINCLFPNMAPFASYVTSVTTRGCAGIDAGQGINHQSHRLHDGTVFNTQWANAIGAHTVDHIGPANYQETLTKPSTWNALDPRFRKPAPYWIGQQTDAGGLFTSNEGVNWWITFVTALGESLPTNCNAAIHVGSTGQKVATATVTLNDIPIGPPMVSNRKLYRKNTSNPVTSLAKSQNAGDIFITVQSGQGVHFYPNDTLLVDVTGSGTTQEAVVVASLSASTLAVAAVHATKTITLQPGDGSKFLAGDTLSLDTGSKLELLTIAPGGVTGDVLTMTANLAFDHVVNTTAAVADRLTLQAPLAFGHLAAAAVSAATVLVHTFANTETTFVDTKIIGTPATLPVTDTSGIKTFAVGMLQTDVVPQAGSSLVPGIVSGVTNYLPLVDAIPTQATDKGKSVQFNGSRYTTSWYGVTVGGLDADRTTLSTALGFSTINGLTWLSTDTGQIFYCNGTAWVLVAGISSGASVSADNAFTGSNSFSGHPLTLGPGANLLYGGILKSTDTTVPTITLGTGAGAINALTDGAMTAGSAALSSASAAFAAGDVGKPITVTGAGAAGATLSSTVAAFVDSTHVTLADAASSTVAGATVTYSSAKATFVSGSNRIRGRFTLTTGTTPINNTIATLVFPNVASDGLYLVPVAGLEFAWISSGVAGFTGALATQNLIYSSAGNGSLQGAMRSTAILASPGTYDVYYEVKP